MAEIEPVVEPYGMLDDGRWESVASVHCWSIHAAITLYCELSCQYPAVRSYAAQGWSEYLKLTNGRGGSFELIADFYKRAVKADPEFTFGYIVLANSYSQHFKRLGIGKEESLMLAWEAIANCYKYAYLRPVKFLPFKIAQDAFTSLCRMREAQLRYLRLFDYQGAKALLNSALDEQPAHHTAHILLSLIAALEQDKSAVLKRTNTLLSIDPRGEALLHHLLQGSLSSLVGQFSTAETAFNKALEIPHNRQLKSYILRCLAIVKIRQGDPDAATDLVAQAWELAGDVDSHVFVEVYDSLGDTKQANALYEAWQVSGRETVHFPYQMNLYPAEEIRSHFVGGNPSAGYTQIHTEIDNRDPIVLMDVLNSEFYDPYRNDPEFLAVMTYLEKEKKLALEDLRQVVLPEN